MTTLAGILLSSQLTLDIAPVGLGYSQRRLIGGASVVQADGNNGGRTLTLEGVNHWTLAQVEQIRAVQAAALPVELVHSRGTFQVLITDTTDLKPTRNYNTPAGSDWYTGAVTMIEV